VRSRRLMTGFGRPLKLDVRRQGIVPLTTSDRQTLIGPAVVGAFLGTLAALLSAGVGSEYGDNLSPLYPGVTSAITEALVTFTVVTVGVVVLFGVAPLLLKRLLSRHTRGPDA
jgi:hypothetical protein